MAPPEITLSFPEHLKLRPIKFQTGLFINNEFVESSDGSTFETINPTNGQSLGRCAEAKEKDIDLAVQAAAEAYKTSWGTVVGGAVRGKMLSDLADAIEAEATNFAAIETLDNGKPLSLAEGDTAAAVAWFRYYAGWADKTPGETLNADPSKFVMTLHEPVGIVGQIIPWNFPLLMLTWKIAPALATGNVIILKPAEQTPLTALYLCRLIAKILPKGVVNICPGFGPVAGNAIVEHPLIDKVAFTGSTAVGKAISMKASKSNLKRVSLELGGKSPNLVFEDANIEEAVKWTGFGIFFNHGQCCCAGSRIYVQESIYDKFLEKFVEHAKSLKVGDPFEPSTYQGPQVSKLQLDRIMGYIDSGKKDGAKCVIGGQQSGKEGFFVEPTVFTNTNPEMKIVQEEVFGPVVLIEKFKTEEEAIEIGNQSIYGLGAGIHTRDLSRTIRVAQKLKAGTVWVNCYNKMYPQAPFGGYKQSGVGRENGRYVLDMYTNVKTVTINLSETL